MGVVFTSLISKGVNVIQAKKTIPRPRTRGIFVRMPPSELASKSNIKKQGTTKSAKRYEKRSANNVHSLGTRAIKRSLIFHSPREMLERMKSWFIFFFSFRSSARRAKAKQQREARI